MLHLPHTASCAQESAKCTARASELPVPTATCGRFAQCRSVPARRSVTLVGSGAPMRRNAASRLRCAAAPRGSRSRRRCAYSSRRRRRVGSDRRDQVRSRARLRFPRASRSTGVRAAVRRAASPRARCRDRAGPSRSTGPRCAEFVHSLHLRSCAFTPTRFAVRRVTKRGANHAFVPRGAGSRTLAAGADGRGCRCGRARITAVPTRRLPARSAPARRVLSNVQCDAVDGSSGVWDC